MMSTQIAIVREEKRIPTTVKVKLGKLQSEFLGDFCMKMIQKINADYVMEQCISAEIYRRYMDRFMLCRAGTFSFKAFEVIALKRLLLNTPMAEPIADSMRNELLGVLHKEIHYM